MNCDVQLITRKVRAQRDDRRNFRSIHSAKEHYRLCAGDLDGPPRRNFDVNIESNYLSVVQSTTFNHSKKGRMLRFEVASNLACAAPGEVIWRNQLSRNLNQSFPARGALVDVIIAAAGASFFFRFGPDLVISMSSGSGADVFGCSMVTMNSPSTFFATSL